MVLQSWYEVLTQIVRVKYLYMPEMALLGDRVGDRPARIIVAGKWIGFSVVVAALVAGYL